MVRETEVGYTLDPPNSLMGTFHSTNIYCIQLYVNHFIIYSHIIIAHFHFQFLSDFAETPPLCLCRRVRGKVLKGGTSCICTFLSTSGTKFSQKFFLHVLSKAHG